MKIVTAAQMQALDRRAIEEAKVPSLTLMTNAGTGVVQAIEQTFGPQVDRVVTIVCGKGNNGGDGLVVARLLRAKRARVQVVLMASPTDLSGDAKVMYRRLVGARRAGFVHVDPAADHLRVLLSRSNLIVDALLGTGLSSPVTGKYASVIDAINEISLSAEVPVVAVDLPSGIHADTGAVLGTAVRAALTVTFGLPKRGFYQGQGIDHAGTIRIVDIGIPADYMEAVESPVSLMTHDEMRRLLPQRKPSAHKGTYGHAAIIAGSVGKTGAAAMTAKAALRVGTGLVTVATPATANRILEAKLLEAMTSPMPETEAHTLALAGLEPILDFVHARSAAAIGPGLTTHPETSELVRSLIVRLERPTVLDADALNALTGHAGLLSACKVQLILTPHPGEMARLDEQTSTQAINADRIETARRFAQGHGVILILKGARTVVAHPDGRAAICPTGNPGMATAGTGDVLTGMIVGLLAQRLSPWDAARAATYFHGLAGDLAAATVGQAGMTAGDLIEQIPHALSQKTPPATI